MECNMSSQWWFYFSNNTTCMKRHWAEVAFAALFAFAGASPGPWFFQVAESQVMSDSYFVCPSFLCFHFLKFLWCVCVCVSLWPSILGRRATNTFIFCHAVRHLIPYKAAGWVDPKTTWLCPEMATVWPLNSGENDVPNPWFLGVHMQSSVSLVFWTKPCNQIVASLSIRWIPEKVEIDMAKDGCRGTLKIWVCLKMETPIKLQCQFTIWWLLECERYDIWGVPYLQIKVERRVTGTQIWQ